MTEDTKREPLERWHGSRVREATQNLPGTERHYVVLFFLIVTLLLTWPLILRPDRIFLTAPPEFFYFQEEREWGVQWFVGHDQLGTEWVDHGLFIGSIEEGARSIQRFELPTVVHPQLSLPPTYVVTGAVVTALFSVSALVFHNVFFVVSVFLAGLFTFLLVREVLGDPEVALLAGVLYMSTFYLYYSYMMGHANQWQIQWIPLILYCIERLRVERSVGITVLFGVSLALQALSSDQYTTYLTFMLPLYVVARYVSVGREFRDLQFLKNVGIASALAFLVASPYIINRLLFASSNLTQVRSLEVNMYHWNVIEPGNVVGVAFGFEAPFQFLFRLSLLGIGLWVLLISKSASWSRLRQLLPFFVFFVVGISMSWGPFAAWAPYTLAYRFWPLVEYFRAPYRMLPFALLGISTISASALFHVKGDGDGPWSRIGLTVVGLITAAQIALVHVSLQFTAHSF